MWCLCSKVDYISIYQETEVCVPRPLSRVFQEKKKRRKRVQNVYNGYNRIRKDKPKSVESRALRPPPSARSAVEKKKKTDITSRSCKLIFYFYIIQTVVLYLLDGNCHFSLRKDNLDVKDPHLEPYYQYPDSQRDRINADQSETLEIVQWELVELTNDDCSFIAN